jgi:hypothetical protein
MKRYFSLNSFYLLKHMSIKSSPNVFYNYSMYYNVLRGACPELLPKGHFALLKSEIITSNFLLFFPSQVFL